MIVSNKLQPWWLDSRKTVSGNPGAVHPALTVRDLGKSYRLFDRPQDRLKQVATPEIFP